MTIIQVILTFDALVILAGTLLFFCPRRSYPEVEE
jgi:hypothetical protein